MPATPTTTRTTIGCFPLMGYGKFALNGIRVSCTFDYADKEPKNIAYVFTLITAGFVSKLSQPSLPAAAAPRPPRSDCSALTDGPTISHAVPFTIITYCYIGMIRVARTSRHTLQRQNLTENSKVNAVLRLREFQLAKVAAKAIICFFCSWFPYVCIAIVTIGGMVSCCLLPP